MPALTLPDSLFARNRLCEDGDNIFRLSPRQRDEYAAFVLPACTQSNHSQADSAFAVLSRLEGRLLPLLYTPLDCHTPNVELRAIASELGQLVDQQADACIASILLSPYEHYTPRHAINAATLIHLLGKAQSLDESTLQSLVCAALTMNIGIASTQDQMARQAAPPTTAQQQLIKLHPLLSSALIREMGITDPLWHETVLMHHEQWNGSGYPFHLQQANIAEHAHLLHIVDMTCSKLMPRSYRNPMPAQQALSILYQNQNQQIDPNLITLLIRTLGIFPPGEFVELDNGMIAIVVERTDNLQAPRVALPAHPRQRIQTDNTPYRIKRPTVPQISARHIHLLSRFWS
ncbi:phosphohydrolase [Rhodobacteraceae bacterium CH30]|nr:phosphohydrolase [Rhodobacteraceae bacterium CH30]